MQEKHWCKHIQLVNDPIDENGEPNWVWMLYRPKYRNSYVPDWWNNCILCGKPRPKPTDEERR